MFFIGPSVNIFVYLLVSAFFVICFYSQTEIRLPGSNSGTGKNYRISNREKRDILLPDDGRRGDYFSSKFSLFKNNRRSIENQTSTYFANYDNPNLVSLALRAPPFVIFRNPLVVNPLATFLYKQRKNMKDTGYIKFFKKQHQMRIIYSISAIDIYLRAFVRTAVRDRADK